MSIVYLRTSHSLISICDSVNKTCIFNRLHKIYRFLVPGRERGAWKRPTVRHSRAPSPAVQLVNRFSWDELSETERRGRRSSCDAPSLCFWHSRFTRAESRRLYSTGRKARWAKRALYPSTSWGKFCSRNGIKIFSAHG